MHEALGLVSSTTLPDTHLYALTGLKNIYFQHILVECAMIQLQFLHLGGRGDTGGSGAQGPVLQLAKWLGW